MAKARIKLAAKAITVLLISALMLFPFPRARKTLFSDQGSAMRQAWRIAGSSAFSSFEPTSHAAKIRPASSVIRITLDGKTGNLAEASAHAFLLLFPHIFKNGFHDGRQRKQAGLV
jgi:hypothetical protein